MTQKYVCKTKFHLEMNGDKMWKNVIFQANTQMALELQFSFLYEKTFSYLSE